MLPDTARRCGEMIRQHLLVLPLLVPLIGALVAVTLRGRPSAWVALGTAVLTLGVDAAILSVAVAEGPRVYRVGGWAPPYGVVLVADVLSALLALTSSVVATASILHILATGTHAEYGRHFQSLFLLMLMALNGVFFSGDLFNLYVFMEMVILSSIVLVALANRPISAETTFKYTVLAAIGSTMLLACIAFVYAGIGTLNLADIAQRVRQGTAAPFWPVVAAILLFVFLAKGATFPFHFWQPDAHSAAPAPVSAMLSGILVKVGVYGIVRMETLLFPGTPVLLTLAPLGAASALFGGLAALVNGDLKRLLAYSTISNVGLIVLALGLGGPLGLTAAVVHTVNHALAKGALFLGAGYVTERLETHELERIGGLAVLTPGGATAFGLGALALAGLPPLGGYLSKLTLFQAGTAVPHPLWLGAAVLASALGISYSLRGFVRVYWGETPSWVADRWTNRDRAPVGPLAPMLLALLSLALGLWPGPFTAVVAATVAELGQPSIYIDAVLGGVP